MPVDATARHAPSSAPMGRPKLEITRDESLLVRCTADERRDIEERAKAAGMATGSYVRRRALGKPCPPKAETDGAGVTTAKPRRRRA